MEPRPTHQIDLETIEAMDLPAMPELDNIDYSDPLAFFRAIGAGKPGGLPMPELVSAAKVRKEAVSRSSSVFKSFNLLRGILDRHEATIQKRWNKKTKEQRRNILLKAWGDDMPKTHRPDFEAFRNESERQREVGTKCRQAFMWPYINQEDLMKPRTLPFLLHARGRHSPSEFAHADIEAMHLGIVTKAIQPLFLNEHVMLFIGRTDERSYGELIEWESHPDAFDWFSSRKGLQPGEGLLILEAQDKLLSFLVSCAKLILHEIEDSSLLDYPVQPVPTNQSKTETGFGSLAVMAAEAPYRPPNHLDFSRIESLLAAKRDTSADHLWFLREDPGYFSDQMYDAKEHRQEMIKDPMGRMHPLFRSNREEILWTRVLGNEVASSYLQLEYWSELQGQALKLKNLQEAYAGKISPDKDLPEDYMTAILRFRHYLYQTAKGPINQLKISAVASPPIRPYFVQMPETNPTETRMRISQKSGLKLNKIEGELFWLLRTLWEDDRNLFLTGMTKVVDELQRLIDSEAKAKSLISSYIASQIGDLSIVCECLRQLDTYQPWASSYDHHLVDLKDKLEEDFAKGSGAWARMLNAIQSVSEVLPRYGSPTEGRFRYPVDKRKTRENIDAMREAEANLDLFWSQLDSSMHRLAGDLSGTAVRHLLSQPRILQRTTPWIEPAQNKSENMKPNDDLVKPLSEVYFELQRRTERTMVDGIGSSQPKIKSKTRGKPTQPTPSPNNNNNLQEPTPSDSTASLPKFSVDKRALKVFRTLFYTPNTTSTPARSWTDFLHAMASIGFMIEKLYGSVWQFRPTKLDVETSIQFHEPHPEGKIPFRTARRHGRRLNRAYGLTGKSFSLLEK